MPEFFEDGGGSGKVKTSEFRVVKSMLKTFKVREDGEREREVERVRE